MEVKFLDFRMKIATRFQFGFFFFWGVGMISTYRFYLCTQVQFVRSIRYGNMHEIGKGNKEG